MPDLQLFARSLHLYICVCVFDFCAGLTYILIMPRGFATDEELAALEAQPLIVGADQLSDNQRAFLNAYIHTGTIKGASKASKITKFFHYNWLHDDASYQAAFALAQAIVLDDDIAEIRKRGIQGWLEPLSYQGQLTGESVRKFSDNLAMFYIKRQDPTFRDNHKVEVEHTGSVVVKHDFKHDDYRAAFERQIGAAVDITPPDQINVLPDKTPDTSDKSDS